MKRTNLPYIPAIILSILTAACSDAPQIPAEELYVRSFVKEFGVPAKSHTWSMASPVEAKISLGGHTNGTATFYTDAPGARDAPFSHNPPCRAGVPRPASTYLKAQSMYTPR